MTWEHELRATAAYSWNGNSDRTKDQDRIDRLAKLITKVQLAGKDRKDGKFETDGAGKGSENDDFSCAVKHDWISHQGSSYESRKLRIGSNILVIKSFEIDYAQMFRSCKRQKQATTQTAPLNHSSEHPSTQPSNEPQKRTKLQQTILNPGTIGQT